MAHRPRGMRPDKRGTAAETLKKEFPNLTESVITEILDSAAGDVEACREALNERAFGNFSVSSNLGSFSASTSNLLSSSSCGSSSQPQKHSTPTSKPLTATVTPRRAQSHENVRSSSSSAGSRTPSCGDEDLPPAIPPRKNPPGGTTLERLRGPTLRKSSAPPPSTLSFAPASSNNNSSTTPNSKEVNPNSSISPEHRKKFEYVLNKFNLQTKDSKAKEKSKVMRPALNKQFSSHENLIGGSGETMVNDGRGTGGGNALFGQQRFLRQGSRDSIHSLDQQHPAQRPHPQQQLQQQQSHQFSQNNPRTSNQNFYRQTSHENLYPTSSNMTVGMGRLNGSKKDLYRPHSREMLHEIHEGPAEGTGSSPANANQPANNNNALSRERPLRRRPVHKSCDNILQQTHHSRDNFGMVGASDSGDDNQHKQQTSPTKVSRPQFLYGIGSNHGRVGSSGHLASPSAANVGGGGGGNNLGSPMAMLNSPQHQMNGSFGSQSSLASPSSAKEKPLTPRRQPSAENLAPLPPPSSRYQVPVSTSSMPPPVPPHGNTPHEAVNKGPVMSPRMFQPLTLEINPGDENCQMAVCMSGFDPQQSSQAQSSQAQLSTPIQVSDPFPSQGGDVYFPPDLASFLPGGGTPRSRLPINSQQSYPPDDRFAQQQPHQQLQQPFPSRWNNGVGPPPPPRKFSHPNYHQHSQSDLGGASSPPPPPPPRISPPKLKHRIFSSQEELSTPVKNSHKNVPHRHSGGHTSAAIVDFNAYPNQVQQQQHHNLPLQDSGGVEAGVTFSTFKPRPGPNFVAHPPSTASSSGVSSWGSSSSFQGVGNPNGNNAMNDASPIRTKVTFMPVSLSTPQNAIQSPMTQTSTLVTPPTPLATQVSTPTCAMAMDEKRQLEIHMAHIGEQRAYEKALIVHQQTRYDHLISQLRSEQNRLDSIVREISQMEQKRTQNRRLTGPSISIAVEDIGNLTAENRRLQVDIEYIGKEIQEEKNNQRVVSDGVVVGNTAAPEVDDNAGTPALRPGVVGDAENFHNNIGWAGQSGRPSGTSVPSPAPSRSGSTRRTATDGSGVPNQWSCPACTFGNHPDMDRCEICEMPRFKGSMVPPGHGNGCYCHPPS